MREGTVEASYREDLTVLRASRFGTGYWVHATAVHAFELLYEQHPEAFEKGDVLEVVVRVHKGPSNA